MDHQPRTPLQCRTAPIHFRASLLTGVKSGGASPGITITVDNPPPTTTVIKPSNGATVSGTQGFDASASPGVTKVQYELTGGSSDQAVIATATATIYGWTAALENHDCAERHLYLAERCLLRGWGQRDQSRYYRHGIELREPTFDNLGPTSGSLGDESMCSTYEGCPISPATGVPARATNIGQDGRMGSEGNKPRKKRRSLKKVPKKCGEPNRAEDLAGAHSAATDTVRTVTTLASPGGLGPTC